MSAARCFTGLELIENYGSGFTGIWFAFMGFHSWDNVNVFAGKGRPTTGYGVLVIPTLRLNVQCFWSTEVCFCCLDWSITPYSVMTHYATDKSCYITGTGSKVICSTNEFWSVRKLYLDTFTWLRKILRSIAQILIHMIQYLLRLHDLTALT